jgi:hypothetical protein
MCLAELLEQIHQRDGARDKQRGRGQGQQVWRFTKRPARVAQILDMLTALGRVRQTPDGRFAGN